ncbi:Hypothetical protein GLP15_2729 [Giardia lamblia P15]|uniref:Centromere/microtubule binding protein cbf5 n=1 Tax=Giardia intestinalis (strain P15) TaxID=658858 RepID=E1F8X2_GIAIA|nr:Hypothetical protein GLP15_2729 [Giardia lamblia P15]
MPVSASVAGRCLSLYGALMDHRVAFKIPRLLYKDFLYALLGERYQDQILLSIIVFRILRKAAIKTGVIGALATLVRYYANTNSRVIANQKVLTRLEKADWQFYKLPFTDRAEILDAVFSATLVMCRSGDTVDAQGALISRQPTGIRISNIKCIGYDALCAEYYILGSTNYIVKVGFTDKSPTEGTPSPDPVIHKLSASDTTASAAHNFECTVLIEPVSFILEAPLLLCDPNFKISLKRYKVLNESVDAYIEPPTNEKEELPNSAEDLIEPQPLSHVSEGIVDSVSLQSSALSDGSYYSSEGDDDCHTNDSSRWTNSDPTVQRRLISKIPGQYNLAFSKFRRKLLTDRFFSYYGRIQARYVELSNNALLRGFLLNFYDSMITKEQVETLVTSFVTMSTDNPPSGAAWAPLAIRTSKSIADTSADTISVMLRAFVPHSSSIYLGLIQAAGLRLLDLAISPSASHLNLLSQALFTSSTMESVLPIKEEREFYTELRNTQVQSEPMVSRFAYMVQLLLSSFSATCSAKQLSAAHRLVSLLLVDAFPEDNNNFVHYLGKTHEHLDGEQSKDRKRSIALNLAPAAKMRETERIESRRALLEQLKREINTENSNLVLKMLSEVRGGWFRKECITEEKGKDNEPTRKRKLSMDQSTTRYSTEDKEPNGASTKDRVPSITVFSFTNEAELDNYIRFLEVQTFHHILSEIVAFYVSTADNDNIYVHRSFSQQREKFLSRYNPVLNLLVALNTEYRMRLREARQDFTAAKLSMGIRFMPEHVGFLHRFPYYYWNMQTLPLQDITLASLWSFMRIWGILDPATSEAGDNFLDSPDGQYCGAVITSLIQELGIENPEFLNSAESDALDSEETHNSNSSGDESSKESEYIPTDATKRQLKRIAKSQRKMASDSSYMSYDGESSS